MLPNRINCRNPNRKKIQDFFVIHGVETYSLNSVVSASIGYSDNTFSVIRLCPSCNSCRVCPFVLFPRFTHPPIFFLLIIHLTKSFLFLSKWIDPFSIVIFCVIPFFLWSRQLSRWLKLFTSTSKCYNPHISAVTSSKNPAKAKNYTWNIDSHLVCGKKFTQLLHTLHIFCPADWKRRNNF